ncbi:MAG: class I SAM-dependent methyltransferase [Candidatus Curtissbacteria bacterium]|nr:class I SAM-dependent methyltransferase [Candidatus Curtissbacteria bacterium]
MRKIYRMSGKVGIKRYLSGEEAVNYEGAVDLFKSSPIPDDQIFSNLGLFLNSKDLSRILFMDFLYRQIIDLQGVVMDFGTRWGHNMAIFSALRGIYEPFNRHKLIVGFDTFSGFPRISRKDGRSDLMTAGNISVTKNYEDYLDRVMKFQEGSNPLSHIKKYELRKGDASVETVKYLKERPETIVALAYFDFDIYEPTKNCLQAILPHLVKGSVVAFDELNDHDSPGETLALKEVLGLNNIKLRRLPITSRTSYFVFE